MRDSIRAPYTWHMLTTAEGDRVPRYEQAKRLSVDVITPVLRQLKERAPAPREERSEEQGL